MLPLLLTGCGEVVIFNPKGSIGIAEKNVILTTGGLMLIVVIPVIVLTIVFAIRYRASRWKEEYAHKQLRTGIVDAAMWLVPAAIVVVLGSIAWVMSHRLDPFRPIEGRGEPVTVQVISMDWKWLFIYPDRGVASINEVAFPVNVPVHFSITSDTVMNSFFIPQLGSQIYAMVGMRTELYLTADTPGTYAGISANISGVGFSGMGFQARALSRDDYDAWLRAARTSPRRLDAAEFARLEKPSENNPVAYYSGVEPGLFSGLMGKYMYSR